jgi:hypothetical protein
VLSVITPTGWWTPEDRARIVRLVQRRPWLFSGLPALFCAYGGYVISASWIRATFVGVFTCLAFRFVLAPYIVRLQKRDNALD